MAGLDSDRADANDHVEAGLWNPTGPFGGLVKVTISDLQALTAAAVAPRPQTCSPSRSPKPKPTKVARPPLRSVRALRRVAYRGRPPLNTVRAVTTPATPHQGTPAPIAARAATPLQACSPAPKTPGAAGPTRPAPTCTADIDTTASGLKATMTTGLDTIITYRAAAVVTAGTGRPGPAAHTARACIDSLTARLNCAQNATPDRPHDDPV